MTLIADVTVGSLIADLQQHDPEKQVRVAVSAGSKPRVPVSVYLHDEDGVVWIDVEVEAEE